MGDLRPELLTLLQHALGLDEHGRGESYRNHFVATPEGLKYSDLSELVRRGLMVEHPPRDIFGGGSCFVVTSRGREVVSEQSPEPPRLTRGQMRYREYLNSECGMSFGEWLRWEARERKHRQRAKQLLEAADA